jgi:hypothetical protein
MVAVAPDDTETSETPSKIVANPPDLTTARAVSWTRSVPPDSTAPLFPLPPT